jgi:ABC-type transporter Mla subunit MlaD
MRLIVHLCLLFLFATPVAHALQKDESVLSEAEVEQLRESAYVPADRIAVFTKFLDARSKAIQDLVAKPRRPGHDDDLHDLLEQFTALADELNDNLDDYGPRHRDLRRQLPKLLEATDRWATSLRTPPESAAYAVSRRLALESVRDVREETTRLIDDQRSFFAAHPEAAKAEKAREAGASQVNPRQ